MTDIELRKMSKAFYEASKEMIEKDIGPLIDILIRPRVVIFTGEKDSKLFDRRPFERDLLALNEEGKRATSNRRSGE